MAKFKTHISFGIIEAFLVTAAFYCCTKLVHPVQAVVIFCLTLIGSAVPDVDSDTARPTQILFGILGIACPVLLLHALQPGLMLKTEEIFCILLAAFLFFQYLLAWFFFRFTVHRGIFHSIPAALIAGECAILLFYNSIWYHRIFFGAAVFLGYMLHLVLDEIYAVDLFGMRLKKSTGSALSFRGESTISTFCAWALVVFLGTLCKFSLYI